MCSQRFISRCRVLLATLVCCESGACCKTLHIFTEWSYLSGPKLCSRSQKLPSWNWHSAWSLFADAEQFCKNSVCFKWHFFFLFCVAWCLADQDVVFHCEKKQHNIICRIFVVFGLKSFSCRCQYPRRVRSSSFWARVWQIFVLYFEGAELVRVATFSLNVYKWKLLGAANIFWPDMSLSVMELSLLLFVSCSRGCGSCDTRVQFF